MLYLLYLLYLFAFVSQMMMNNICTPAYMYNMSRASIVGAGLERERWTQDVTVAASPSLMISVI